MDASHAVNLSLGTFRAYTISILVLADSTIKSMCATLQQSKVGTRLLAFLIRGRSAQFTLTLRAARSSALLLNEALHHKECGNDERPHT